MGMGKQAKIINEHQLQALLAWLETRKHATRNRLIVLLSFKAGQGKGDCFTTRGITTLDEKRVNKSTARSSTIELMHAPRIRLAGLNAREKLIHCRAEDP
jgi:hypothetical protein